MLAAPNEFTQTVLESRMRRVLAEALSEQFGRDIRVAVQLEDAPAEAPAEDARRGADPPSVVVGRGSAEAQRAEEDRASRDRADDGRSAFGVRTDAVGSPPWDRDAPRSADGRADPRRPRAACRSTGRRRGRSTAARPRTGRPPPGAAPTAAGRPRLGRRRAAAPPTSCPSTSTRPATQRARPAAARRQPRTSSRAAARPGWTRA